MVLAELKYIQISENVCWKISMQSKVSMVMPCYNKVEYIGDMFDSIIVQKWDNIELILVNDGSTDGTREVISQYEPKFINRGYDVVIVDKENAGVCAASKAGLKRVTGDYVCMVDADDELDPEYVSTMAGCLQQHGDCDFVSCDFQTYTIVNGEKVFAEFHSHYLSESRIDLFNLRQYLLGKICMSVWVYMLRVSYLNKCDIINDYYTNTAGSHEPGYIIPILANGGRIKYFPLPLYKFNILEESHSKTKEFSKYATHWNEYERLVIIALNHLSEKVLLPQSKLQVINCFRLTKYYKLVNEFKSSKTDLYNIVVSEAVDFLNELDLKKHLVTPGDIYTDYNRLFNKARTWAVRRIIGYGAKGRAAKWLVPRLFGTRFEPTELWDINTGEMETDLYGLPLKKPAFDDLANHDIILVMVKASDLVQGIQKTLSKYATLEVLYFEELRRMIYYYGNE